MIRIRSTTLLTGLSLILAVTSSFAQSTAQPPSQLTALQDQQTLTGGVGMTIIDGKPYYLLHVTPELAFGKIGVGLDVNLRISEDGQIRHEDFQDFNSYLQIIRYVRYGQKHDPWYARIGALDYSRLGHGYIMYMYRNTASYDLRKVGVEFDADLGTFGFESMYSDVSGGGVLGLRGYTRPLQFTDAASIPIVGKVETGVTLATDLNAYAKRTWGDSIGTIRASQGNGTLSILGVDIGFPLLSQENVHSTLYADVAKIVSFGGGAAVGLDLELRGLGLVTFNAKYERRIVGNRFMPSYFNALYEHDRYQPVDSTRFVSKAQLLSTSTAYDGYFGELLVSILNTFNIVGGYQAPLGRPNGGTLHLEFETLKAMPGIVLSAGYDKQNIGSIFKLDNNSLLYARVGYMPYPYLVVSTLYQWTWSEVHDPVTGKVTGYKSQKRIEPQVGFVVHF